MEGEIPSPKDICTKQLYKVMDQIDKTDVDEEQIAPFMADINRRFDYMEKEELIKKIVALEFGKFLAYYADAPEISKPEPAKREKKEKNKGKDGGNRKPEKGFRRLFINLGKDDGFYPGEIMQFINRNVEGKKVAVGHIDLLAKIAYIEVSERDARRVMDGLNGAAYRNRNVRCNDADNISEQRKAKHGKQTPPREERNSKRKGRKNKREIRMESGRKDDWRQFFQGHDIQLVGEEPDFSEEGWARRKPKKKKK